MADLVMDRGAARHARDTVIGIVRMMLARDNPEQTKARAEENPEGKTSLWIKNRNRLELIEALEALKAPGPGLPIVTNPALPEGTVELRSPEGELMAQVVRVKG